MVDTIAKNWWSFLLRGVVSILFGLMALSWPGLTIAALIVMFAAYAIVDGAIEVAGALRGGSARGPRWMLILSGLLSIGAGAVTFVYPGLTALMLLYFIAAWAILHGFAEIAAAIRLRKEIRNEWFFVLTGLSSIAFGVLLLARPGAGALAVVWVIASMSIVIGVMLIGLSLRLRSLARQPAGSVPVGAQ
jgi:uncharacterized membrane protein HdeD (DUF308 family)